MSFNPFHHPLAITIVVAVASVSIYDAIHHQFDLALGGHTVTRVLNVPLWIVLISFGVIGFLRNLFDSACFQIIWSYVTHRVPKRELHENLHELSQFQGVRRPKLAAVNTSHSTASAFSASTTPGTARIGHQFV